MAVQQGERLAQIAELGTRDRFEEQRAQQDPERARALAPRRRSRAEVACFLPPVAVTEDGAHGVVRVGHGGGVRRRGESLLGQVDRAPEVAPPLAHPARQQEAARSRRGGSGRRLRELDDSDGHVVRATAVAGVIGRPAEALERVRLEVGVVKGAGQLETLSVHQR